MTRPKNFLSGLFRRTEGETPPASEKNAVETAAGTTGDNLPSTDGRAEPAPAADEEKPVKEGFFSRLASGLSRTSRRLSDGVASIVAKKKLDDDTLGEIEELLIGADLGVTAAARVRDLIARDRFDKEISDAEVKEAVAVVVAETLKDREKPLVIDRSRKPHVVLAVGVNGSGKTTTIGKLAGRFQGEGLTVMLAAGDTFRAAAVEQLKIWGERTGAAVIARKPGADAAGLAFEALERAKREGADALLIDTAGRLQNRRELMDELAKIVRVLKKLDPEAPHDTLLVLDATVGQNALSQADAFREIAGVTGLVMTKLDGTARGGVLVALAERHPLPIHFIGVGERVEDLQPFAANSFARALAGLSPSGGRG